MKYPQGAAISSIAKIFGLKIEDWMQDWEIECADPRRIEEYLNGYDGLLDNDEERFALMQLILGCFETYHASVVRDDVVWGRVKGILEKNYLLHEDQIKYYNCEDQNGREDIFPITKLMKTVKNIRDK